MNIIHQTKHFTFSQSDKKRCFYLDFGHKQVEMRFCQLLAFRQQILEINLESHFNGENIHGLEILSLCNREHLVIFNTYEILELKELMATAFGFMEMNSLLA